MLLENHGHRTAPRDIEIATGVALGALIEPDGLLWLNQVAPDVGISSAFRRLGWSITHEFDTPRPIDRLRDLLATGPVIVGPVDMARLTYLRPAMPPGSDHYVLAYGIDGDNVLLHDPAGFPHVRLGLDAFEEAWRAELVNYRFASYQCWHSPVRTGEALSAADLVADFRADYQNAAKLPFPSGAAAIRQVADSPLAENQLEHLVEFMLPVAAARANHYAAYFTSHDKMDLAAVKHTQADVLGRAYLAAHTGDTPALARLLHDLADTESTFAATLLGPKHERISA